MLQQLLAHYINSAHAANGRGEFKEAAGFCGQALQLVPDLPEAWFNLGIAQAGMGLRQDALASFERVRLRVQDSADAQNSLGLRLTELGAYAQAEQCLLRALALAPDYAFAHSNLGRLRERQKLFREAESCFRKAIALQPELAPLHANLGGILSVLKDHAAAEAACRRAIELDPALPLAWVNLGDALYEMGRHEEAAACFRQGLALNPSDDYLRGVAMHASMKICDWRDHASDLPVLLRNIESGRKAANPFDVLGLTADPALQLRAAQAWVRYEYPAQSGLGPMAKHAPHERLRIGYFSADFHDHATTFLMAGLFEQHDKAKFELIGFSYGPDKNDAMRKRVAAAFDRFIDVRARSDLEIAQLARELEVDIAVDLKGFTQDARPGIFALSAAPIQVSYLGYPGTMGADYMDYLLADPVLIPAESRPSYQEKVVRLPHSYQVNDNQRRIADSAPTRTQAGLPDQGVVFCCFNNSYKITPATFDGWMRILQQVNGSVLWLLDDNPAATRNLRRAAEARGIDAARLVFAPRLPMEEHLARHRLADLFLDTQPYNAHTTASDALWAGLPVLTCPGPAFASRVAASLLAALDLPELIASDQARYESLAVSLASEPERLQQVRQKLVRNRLTAPLFNTSLFARHIEQAYCAMMERQGRGLPPEDFDVPA